MNKRFLKIISNCESLREKHGLNYEEKCKSIIDRYSKEIIDNKLIEKCGDSYFAKQLCISNELRYC